jgi:PIN domain nuclease of toxin-antitoxin system
VNLLLDTHAVLWWFADDPALSSEARRAIGNAATNVCVSPVTPWEIAIKSSAGKLKAPDNLLEAIKANRFRELPISLVHAERAGNLPPWHRDPFDRMLIAQALSEGLTLVTRDRIFEQYDVNVLRA